MPEESIETLAPEEQDLYAGFCLYLKQAVEEAAANDGLITEQARLFVEKSVSDLLTQPVAGENLLTEEGVSYRRIGKPVSKDKLGIEVWVNGENKLIRKSLIHGFDDDYLACFILTVGSLLKSGFTFHKKFGIGIPAERIREMLALKDAAEEAFNNVFESKTIH